jgi:hypothetical protein
MKRYATLSLGLLATLGWLIAAKAQEPLANPPKPANGATVYHYGGESCMTPHCCEPEHRGGGLQAGVGFYYIQPHWDHNPAYLVLGTDNLTRTVTSQQDFDYDYEFAPRAWLGFTSCNGSGVRVRWWDYEDDASVTAQAQPFTGIGTQQVLITPASPLGVVSESFFATGTDTLTVNSDLQVTVWDLEGTYNHQAGCFLLTFFGGLRYVHLSQSYNAVLVENDLLVPQGNGNGNLENVSTLLSGHNFKGVGPTGGVESRTALGGMGLSLYGSSRVSVLFGTGKQSAFVNEPALIIDGIGVEGLQQGGSFASLYSRDDILPIVEAEIGAEWSGDVCGMRAFVQAALVGQVWFGAGNASRSTGPSFEVFYTGGDDTNLGFFGGTIVAGVNY